MLRFITPFVLAVTWLFYKKKKEEAENQPMADDPPTPEDRADR